MKRIHLFEIEDQIWCPQFIRETTTDFLAGVYRVFNLFHPAYEKIAEVLQITKTDIVVDCCSGSAGPIKQLRDYLNVTGNQSVLINLTDKYPNIVSFKKLEQQFPQQIKAHFYPLDAAQFPPALKGMRTFFSSFHHFPPKLAIKILQDAVNNQAPIGIFESTQRHPIDFVRALFSPLLVLLLLPFAKRMTWSKFLFTYVLPITPLTTMWDYLVSNLRSYSIKELHTLVSQLDAPGYQWEIGKLWSKKGKCYIPYLVGYKL